MRNATPPQLKPPITLLVVLIAFSIFVALISPSLDWQILYAALACYSLITLIFQFGWLIPCTVIGAYLGTYSAPLIIDGSIELQIATLNLVGAVIGLFAGLMIDDLHLERNKTTKEPASPTENEPQATDNQTPADPC